MQYQVIVTLGPASGDSWLWGKIIDAGADVFRLNTSHISLDQLNSWLEELAAFIVHRSYTVPVVLDLQGSKWRLGQFQTFFLDTGQRITLVFTDTTEYPAQLPVPHPDFFQASNESGKEIVLSDAKIRLEIEKASTDIIQAVVIQGGEISSRKGITYADSDYRVERLSQKDQAIIERSREYPFVRYAVSYVRDSFEMARYRQQIGDKLYVIAKLERQPALDQIDQIAKFSNEIWLCRGDLGAELGMKGMAETVHQFANRMHGLPVPVILAGQVLEHMVYYPTPTRSEICYLYDIIKQGYSGLVLSDETAIGRYPVESVVTAGMFKG